MEASLTWLWLLAAIPAAWLGVVLVAKGFRRAAFLWVRLEKATKVLLYELVPNEGDSLKDKVDDVVRITKENQRALEMHLVNHHEEIGE
jgi:hypothetical protein